MAVGQNQWYHFGIGAPPILIYFNGDWDVHWGYDLGFDPWPNGFRPSTPASEVHERVLPGACGGLCLALAQHHSQHSGCGAAQGMVKRRGFGGFCGICGLKPGKLMAGIRIPRRIGVAQNEMTRVTVFVFGSIYQGTILVHFLHIPRRIPQQECLWLHGWIVWFNSWIEVVGQS